MKARELKKLIADVDDDLEVVISVTVGNLTYSAPILSGDLGHVDNEANVFSLDVIEDADCEDYKKLPLVYDLYGEYGEGWEDDFWN